jgi:hypothetical protein
MDSILEEADATMTISEDDPATSTSTSSSSSPQQAAAAVFRRLEEEEDSRDLGRAEIPPFGSLEESFEEESDDPGSDDANSDSDSESQPQKPGDSRLVPYEDLTETQSACLNFAMEHRIFLKAILGLLAERDKKATEIGMNDPNTLKCGPLKKASHLVSGVWKVKFVEVRRGMFSYYEDAVSGDKAAGSLLRKNLPLDSNACSCRAVKIHRNGLNMTPGGAILELKVGNTRRLWLAKSRAERHAWIQAINDAMVGGSVTQGSIKEQHGKSGSVSSKSPYKKDLRQYLKVKVVLKNAQSKQEYVPALREVLGSPLDIPVQWIMGQVESPSTDEGAGAFQEAEMSSGVKQLWRDLLRDSILINLELFHGDSGHGPEKIIGALARNIVGISRSSTGSKYATPESKAIAYARDILLSINRTRSGGDSYFCIDTLCNNPNLVVTVPSSIEAEPLSISVEIDQTEDSTEYSVNDKTGWIRTRNRIQMSWRKRFFVLSEGTLSLYRNATPRPHGLRGQMVVTDATISVDKSKEKSGYFTISIVTKDGLKDRYLYFNNTDKLLAWAYALECTAKGSSLPMSGKGRFGLRSSPRDAKPSENTNSPDGSLMVEQSMRNHVERLGLACDDVDERIARFSAKTSSRVKVSVQASSEYKICTTDPQGDDGDTWATLSATFLQTFRISGDRIIRGEELVRIQVIDCPDLIGFAETLNTLEAISSPNSPRRVIGRRMRLSTT